MKTVALALRNLLRNRRRSLSTLLAIVIGVVSILMFGGYIRSVKYGLQTGFVQRSGHLQIQHKDFFLYGSGNPAAFGITDYQNIIDAVKRDPVLSPMLTVVTPTLQISGIAGNFAAGVSRTVVGSGTVVDEQNEMRKWNDYNYQMLWRPMALSGTSENSAVIGTGVARVLELCEQLSVSRCPEQYKKQMAEAQSAPQDIIALSSLEKSATPGSKGDTRIDLLTASVKGAPNVAGLNVVQAELQGFKEFDDLYIGLHLAQAQKLVFGNAPPQVTSIALQLKHTDQIPAAKERLEQLLVINFDKQPLAVQEFTTLNPIYGQTVGMFRTIFSFIALLMGAVVLFTVGNTMSMAVVERTLEIGTLRAMGARRSAIRRLFLCEGLLLGVIGTVSGIVISIVLSTMINNMGITWVPPGYAIAVPVNVYVAGETGLVMSVAIGIILVATLSAWWPAKRAAKLQVVDALRHV